MGKLNDDIAFWHWARARQAKSGVSWSSYWSTLISATVETAAPTHVVLTFPSEGTSVSTDITCTVNSVARVVSSASWTDGVWTVVLDSAVVYGDVVAVTFIPAGETGAVTNNVAAEAEATALFARITTVSDAQKKTLNDLIRSGKAHGWYAKGDCFYVNAQETEQAARLNIIEDAHNLTGSPTFTTNVGFAGNGSSTYLDTNYNPATEADNLALDSTSFVVGIQNSRATATKAHGNARLMLLPLYVNQQQSKCNDNTFAGFIPLTGASKGIMGINRNAAGTYASWKQRVKNTLTVTSTSISSVNMYLLAANTGSASFYCDDTISFAFIGAGLTDGEYTYLINDVDTYLREYNIGLLPYGECELLALSGQSNAEGQGDIADLPEAYEGEQDDFLINFNYSGNDTFNKANADTIIYDDFTNCGSSWGAEQSGAHDQITASGNDVVMVKISQSGQRISAWDAGAGLYVALETRLINALNNNGNNFLTFNTLSLLWMQGEADAAADATTAYYEAKLRDLIARLRASDTRLANLQFVLAKLPAIMAAYTAGQKAEINTAFANVAADTTGVVVLDTDAITGLTIKADVTHYDGAGLLKIGSAWQDLMA